MHRLSDTLGPSKSTIHHHLTALGKIYKSCRFAPHELTVEQTQRRVKFCRKLLHLPKDHHFIKRIITCDEKWIYLNNPDLQKRWLNKGQLPVLVTMRVLRKKKVLLCVWWNYEGLIYYELVPDGCTISAEKMYMVFLEKYPVVVNQKQVLLQQDNACPHTAKKTLQKIEELEGSKLLLCNCTAAVH
jgi:histone-lysine N-methyltransferase SETMAR